MINDEATAIGIDLTAKYTHADTLKWGELFLRACPATTHVHILLFNHGCEAFGLTTITPDHITAEQQALVAQKIAAGYVPFAYTLVDKMSSHVTTLPAPDLLFNFSEHQREEFCQIAEEQVFEMLEAAMEVTQWSIETALSRQLRRIYQLRRFAP